MTLQPAQSDEPIFWEVVAAHKQREQAKALAKQRAAEADKKANRNKWWR